MEGIVIQVLKDSILTMHETFLTTKLSDILWQFLKHMNSIFFCFVTCMLICLLFCIINFLFFFLFTSVSLVFVINFVSPFLHLSVLLLLSQCCSFCSCCISQPLVVHDGQH